MLTVIPQKEFLELTKGIKEAGSSKTTFKWNEMLKHSKTQKSIQEYVKSTNCKFVGSGSGRHAYFLPVGAYDTEYLNAPSCFKVAWNEKGAAQNDVEVKMLDRYSEKWDCFPKLYDWDGDNNFFMLCEVGTPAIPMDDEEMIPDEEYFDDWRNFGTKYFAANKAKIEKLKTSNAILNDIGLEHTIAVSHIRGMFDFASIYHDVYLDSLDSENKEQLKETFSELKKFVEELCKKHKKYIGIKSYLDFNCRGNGTIEIEDMDSASNWAYVQRGNDLVLIPIDWGFNDEVAQKYYS